jgi:hypothetical protein
MVFGGMENMSDITLARDLRVLRQYLINKHTEWILSEVNKMDSNYINVNPIVDALCARDPGVSRYTLRRTVTKTIELHGAERINPRGVYSVDKLKKE